MYIPKHFEVNDREEIFSFIEANAFGQLISTLKGKLFSTHIPFLVNDDRSKLFCHLAKANPQWKNIAEQEILVTLQGAHDYISPSWYSSPSVSTWNYQAVHIYGKCKTFTEPDKLKHIVDSLTERYESSFEKPWIPTYKEAMLKGIVGIEIEIGGIQCQYKLNQNRSKQDQTEVAKQLEIRGSSQLSMAMKKTSNRL